MSYFRGWLCAAVAVLAIGATPRAEAIPQLQLSISDGVNPTVLLIDTLSTGGLVHVGTQSDDGRDCRDTFLGLMHTCAKLGVSFWDYLADRIGGIKAPAIPGLPDLIRTRTRAA